jgi:hypothetical protein
MKPLAVPMLAIALMTGLSAPSARADVAGRLSISESPVAIEMNTGAVFTGEKTLYLWTEIGASALEFGLDSNWDIVSLTPAPGFVNASGNKHSPYVVAEFPPLCIDPLTPFATLVVRDVSGDGGSVCFVPAESSGRICYSPCGSAGWTAHDDRIGFSTDGTPLCLAPETDCFPTDLAVETWGQLKAIYR